MIRVTPNEWAIYIAKYNYYFSEPNSKTLPVKRKEDNIELGRVNYTFPQASEHLINPNIPKLPSDNDHTQSNG